MKTSKKSTKIKGVKSSVKSSSKQKYDIQDLETDKESIISDYDESSNSDLWEINSNNKSKNKIMLSKIKQSNKNFGTGFLARADDLRINSSIKSYKKGFHQSINYGNQSFSITNMSQTQENIDFEQEYDSEEEMEEDQQLTFEQKILKEKWIQIFKKLQKNKIKQDEAFDYSIEDELELALYEWKDSGCILESISKLFSLKVDRLSKETYQLLAQIVRGDIGMKKTDMEDENEENHQEEYDQQDQNNKKKKIFKFEEKEIIYGSFYEFNPLSAGLQSLEKPEKLIVEKYDIEFDLDPLFRKTSQYFDEASSGGLLINSLNIDQNLLIKLTDINDMQIIQNEIQIENNKQEANSESKNEQNTGIRDNDNINNTKSKKPKRFNYMKDFQTQEFQMKNQDIIQGFEIDLLPELVDFKMTVIDELRVKKLNFDEIPDQQLSQENGIRILNQNQRRMEVVDEVSNTINSTANTAAETENDKNLFNEINQAFETTSFSQQNIMYRNLGDDSIFYNIQSQNRDSESSFLSQNYTPDNSILSKNNKRIRFDNNDQYFGSSTDTFYFSKSTFIFQQQQQDDNPSSSGSINSQLVTHSILKVGGGDKSLISNSLLQNKLITKNINWGDPKQWELQKQSLNQKKKQRQKKVDDMLLGEIKEDMEAEDQNENNNLNGQYKSLTKPIKYFDFQSDMGVINQFKLYTYSQIKQFFEKNLFQKKIFQMTKQSY